MSLADRIVDVAVAVSPAAHRPTRAEQWRADIRDAGELDLSPTRLALGALTTAVFRRRPTRRSTWESRMNATPHTIRTVPLLVGLAFLSLVAGAGSVLVFGRYNGSQWSFIVGIVATMLLCVVPGACMVGAVLFADRATPRRRVIGALLILFLALRLGTVVVGAFRVGPDWVWIAVVATGSLATWFFVQRRRGSVWVLLVLPVVTLAILEPVALAWSRETLSSPAQWAATWLPIIGPFASAVIAGIVSSRSVPDRSTGPGLVDRGV